MKKIIKNKHLKLNLTLNLNMGKWAEAFGIDSKRQEEIDNTISVAMNKCETHDDEIAAIYPTLKNIDEVIYAILLLGLNLGRQKTFEKLLKDAIGGQLKIFSDSVTPDQTKQ